ncbi:MAG: chromate transporter [Clostridiales bacterium]|nr:chromate transporter [Clostridiales bacterium]
MILTLFISFLKVGLFSVGGGYAAIPLIQNQIVELLGLMTMAEFTDLITIAEMTPGPISINSSTFVGMRLNGIPGVLICTLGVVLPAFIICLTLAFFYYKYRNFSGVQTVLSALRPAVVALIAGAGLNILLLGLFNADKTSINFGDFRIIEFGLFAGALFLLRKYKLNAITVIFGTGVIGTILYAIF